MFDVAVRPGGDNWRFLPAVLLCVLSALGAVGCGGETVVVPPTTTDGEELFMLRAMGGEPGCVTCHSLAAGSTIVGPSLAGIADRAAGRVGGLDAPSYLEQSIVDPDAFVVDGFESGKMPGVWGDVLSADQIDALVQYLLELP